MIKRQLRRIIPAVISLALIAVLIGYAPWKEVFHVLSDLDIGPIIILILLSLAYYGFKALRFWYILRAIDIDKPLTTVALSYMSAQPVSLLPGGEMYRSNALNRYTGVPVHRSIGQFTLQGLLEGMAMAALLLLSALVLGKLRQPALILCVIVLVVLLLIQAGYLKKSADLLNRLPFINIAQKHIDQFSRSNRKALSREWLPKLFGLSLLIELVGVAIAYTATAGIGGHINFFQASFLYVIPIIVGFISFLPGGLGISEQSAVGVLLLSGIKLPIAVSATLIMRITIVGFGVVYGLLILAAESLNFRNFEGVKTSS